MPLPKIHSFIHMEDLYSALSRKTTQRRKIFSSHVHAHCLYIIKHVFFCPYLYPLPTPLPLYLCNCLRLYNYVSSVYLPFTLLFFSLYFWISPFISIFTTISNFVIYIISITCMLKYVPFCTLHYPFTSTFSCTPVTFPFNNPLIHPIIYPRTLIRPFTNLFIKLYTNPYLLSYSHPISSYTPIDSTNILNTSFNPHAFFQSPSIPLYHQSLLLPIHYPYINSSMHSPIRQYIRSSFYRPSTCASTY